MDVCKQLVQDDKIWQLKDESTHASFQCFVGTHLKEASPTPELLDFVSDAYLIFKKF